MGAYISEPLVVRFIKEVRCPSIKQHTIDYNDSLIRYSIDGRITLLNFDKMMRVLEIGFSYVDKFNLDPKDIFNVYDTLNTPDLFDILLNPKNYYYNYLLPKLKTNAQNLHKFAEYAEYYFNTNENKIGEIIINDIWEPSSVKPYMLEQINFILNHKLGIDVYSLTQFSSLFIVNYINVIYHLKGIEYIYSLFEKYNYHNLIAIDNYCIYNIPILLLLAIKYDMKLNISKYCYKHVSSYIVLERKHIISYNDLFKSIIKLLSKLKNQYLLTHFIKLMSQKQNYNLIILQN